MNFIKLIKPLVFEFNSWCCSFRLSYGDQGGGSGGHPPQQKPAIGFGMDNHPDEDEGDEDEGRKVSIRR